MFAVDIIVPIYNVKDYLCKCIDSILVQTFSNYGGILIDDGSDDNSGTICDEFITIDSRLTVLHLQNRGVSNARNIGIQIAESKQILFIDSDDTIKPEYVQELLFITNEDLVQSNCTVLKDDFFKPMMSHGDIMQDFGRYWLESGSCSCWGKSFRTSFLRNNNIFFDTNLSFGEDEKFVIDCLKKANYVRRIQYNGYCYNQNVPNSAMKNIKWNRLELEELMCKNIESVITNKDSKAQIRWLSWHYVINHFKYFASISIDLNQRKKICLKLKEAYRSPFFRDSIEYVSKNGTIDERIEARLMGYYRHKLFKPTLLLVQAISNLKHTLLGG